MEQQDQQGEGGVLSGGRPVAVPLHAPSPEIASSETLPATVPGLEEPATRQPASPGDEVVSVKSAVTPPWQDAQPVPGYTPATSMSDVAETQKDDENDDDHEDVFDDKQNEVSTRGETKTKPLTPEVPHSLRDDVLSPDFDEDEIPELGDKTAPKFDVGEDQLSPNAIRQRAKRIFTPRVDGSLKVSETIFREWKSKGQPRKNLEQIFKSVGYDVDP